MKTMSSKPDMKQAVANFVAKGGVIKKLPPKVRKDRNTNPAPQVVEIDISSLPKELLKYIA